MTTPVRFWRLYFRSVNTYNYGQLIFRTLKPHDANGNPLISGVTLSISAGLMNGTSFPLANLIDTDTATATYCGVNYPDYQTTTSWRFVQFTYTDPVYPFVISVGVMRPMSQNGSVSGLSPNPGVLNSAARSVATAGGSYSLIPAVRAMLSAVTIAT